jgi:hypothetical protein
MACMVRASCFTTARFVLHHQHAAATSQPLHAIMPIMLVKRGLHSEWWWQPPVTILSFIALHLRTHQHACIQLLPVYVTSRHTIARAVQHSHALIALYRDEQNDPCSHPSCSRHETSLRAWQYANTVVPHEQSACDFRPDFHCYWL